jgi:FixJ family two-component response regulator
MGQYISDIRMNTRRYIGVIDDDESLRRSLGRLLQLAGFQPVLFPSAEEFLTDPLRMHLRCLLIDVRLGGMSGIELHECLIAEGIHIPVIYITAHDDPETRASALRNRCAGFFRKTDPGEDIMAAVARATTDPPFVPGRSPDRW